MFSVGSVELLILSILPIVVMFVVLYLVIKWAVYARGEIGREEYERMRRDIQAE